MSFLDTINSPQDLKKINDKDLPALCEEIRSFLIESVSKTGGHLASNLGAVEITVALHRVFETPKDKILFDVGHQCYTHKILTGRKEGFSGLRKLNGLSGFPSPRESEHDTFIAGHGNAALSTAIGVAQAKKLKNEPGFVIALIGDGALTGGMVYEGMNNAENLDNLIVVLNDNKMSISKNRGSLARHLTKLRTMPTYHDAKENVSGVLNSVPLVGKGAVSFLQSCKTAVRRSVYPSAIFEEMGFQYIGPVNGHDVNALEDIFENCTHYNEPVFVHVVTQKGKGYKPAEENPGEFHGVSAFDPDHFDPEVAPKASFSTEFGQELSRIADEDKRICAITAAMKYGTGLQHFYRNHRDRFFDVGMAEQHAVTFAGGLACQGMLPVVAIYSTFMQRAYDSIIHDNFLMDLDVVYAIDRSGLVPGDGETHQGIYDVSFLSSVGVPIVSPSNYEELRFWLNKLLKEYKGQRAIRYPRGGEDALLAELGCSGREYDIIHADKGNAKTAIITYGSETSEALKAAKALTEKGVACDVVKLVKVFPLSNELVHSCAKYDAVMIAEEGVCNGGIGEKLSAALLESGWSGKIHICAVDNHSMPHATVPQIRTEKQLDAQSLIEKMEDMLP